MEPRRIVGIVSLGLVGAVVWLVASTDEGTGPAPSAATAVTVPADDVALDQPGSQSGSESRSRSVAATPTTVDALVPELADRGPHRPLVGIEGWLQSDITSLDELRGKVVAVQFWTFGCSNCRATLPHLRDLYEKYAGDDFEIVGVHAPEFEYERDRDAVAAAAIELGVSWPIALDGEKRSFRSWQDDRRFWPRLYLLDRDGNVRYDAIGEGRYDTIEAAVGALIAEVP